MAVVAFFMTASSEVTATLPHSDHEAEAQLLFADGSPAADMELGVALRTIPSADDESRQVSYSKAQTDGSGWFQLQLPESGTFEVVLDAWSKNDKKQRVYEIWPAKPQVVLASDSEFSFTIDNSYSMKVVVQTSKPFPASLPLHVRCRRDTHYQGHLRTVQSAKTTSAGGDVEFSSLTPGKYEITVAIDKWSKFKWTRTLEIPAKRSGGLPRQLTFQLPELAFGSLTGKVAMQDGSPLKGNNSLQMQIRTIGGSTRFDVHSRRYVLRDIPTGPITLASNVYRVAGETRATVHEDKAASAGKILLKPYPKPASRRKVSGNLKFDDGTAIDGAQLGWIPSGGFERMPQTTTDKQGKLEYEMYVTHSFVRFNLSRSNTWLKARNRPMPTLGSLNDEAFYARIKPGNEDLSGFNPTLPHPSRGYGDLSVTFKNFDSIPSKFANLRVITADGEYRSRAMGWPQNESLQFTSVPPGKREILCPTPVIGLYPTFEKTSGKEEVIVDALDSGRILIVPDRAVHDISVQVENLSIPKPAMWASEDLLNQGRTHALSGPSKRYNFQWSPQPSWARLVNEPRPKSLNDAGTTVHFDGTIQPPRFAPARYRLRLRRLADEYSDWVEFDLKRGDELRFEVPIEKDGTPGAPRQIKQTRKDD